MMASQMIDDLYVQISEKGLGAVTSALSGLQSGLGQVKSVLDTVRQGFLMVAGPAAAVTATITGLALAGFQGTVQMQQLQMNFQMMTREIASIMIPVIEVVTALFQKMWLVLSRLGGDGQRFLLAIAVAVAAVAVGLGGVVMALTAASAAVGVLIGVASILTVVVSALAAVITGATGGLNLLLAAIATLATIQFAAVGTAMVSGFAAVTAAWGFIVAYSKELRAALWMVIEAFGGVVMAAWPIVKAFLAVGAVLLQSFVIEPLIDFAHWLTMILMIAEKLITRFIALVPIIGRLASGLNLGGGQRRDVTLNQTGEESASGSFQRIQQATLQATAGAEQSPLEANTEALKNVTAKVEQWMELINAVLQRAGDMVAPVSGLISGGSPIGVGVNYGLRMLGVGS